MSRIHNPKNFCKTFKYNAQIDREKHVRTDDILGPLLNRRLAKYEI